MLRYFTEVSLCSILMHEWICHVWPRSSLQDKGVMQYASCFVFSWRSSKLFFLPLLSDEGLDFYVNENPSHRVYMLNEALDRVNLYWLFIIFFFCPVLSSNLNFLQLCLSSFLGLLQFTLCLSIHSCLMYGLVISSPHAFPQSDFLKVMWWIARGIHVCEYKPNSLFLSPAKTASFLFNVCAHVPFHLQPEATEKFPPVDTINLN